LSILLLIFHNHLYLIEHAGFEINGSDQILLRTTGSNYYNSLVTWTFIEPRTNKFNLIYTTGFG